MAIISHMEQFTLYEFLGDEKGGASIQGICEYMQEAAGNHASKLGLSIDRLYREKVAWVLVRLRLVPERMPALHSRIVVETWPVGVDGLQYRRDFIIRDAKGNVLLRALSQWVVVSLETRKVGRVPAFITEAGLGDCGAATALDDGKHRLPEVDAAFETCLFRARLSDVDRNQHVNNVRYMDWILESVPDAIRSGRLAELELAFRAEAYKGDMVAVRTMPDDLGEGATSFGKVLCHSLVRQSDNKELVRAKSVWA